MKHLFLLPGDEAIELHLAALNDMHHCLSHSSRLRRSSCSAWQSALVSTFLYSTQSSAKRRTLELTAYREFTLMNARKSCGPSD